MFNLWKPRISFGNFSPTILFYFSLILFTVPFLISRFWFFKDYPFVGIYPDSSSYYAPMAQLKSGLLPIFAIRPPLYPLFLLIVVSIFDSAISVVVIQNILTFFACVYMIYSVYKIKTYLAPLAAIGLMAWATSYSVLEHDTSLLSESLYAICLLFGFANLLTGIIQNSKWALFWASVAMGGAIWTRPAGMFLLVIFLVVLLFIFRNKYGNRMLLAFAIPLPAMLLALMFYNYKTFDSFAITSFGETNLAVATLTFWETNPEFPSEINSMIEGSVKIVGVTDAERQILTHSWEVEVLAPIFLKGFNVEAYSNFVVPSKDLQSNVYSTETRSWVRTVSLNAISKNPSIYARFVKTFLELYFKGVAYDADLIYSLRDRVWLFYVDGRYAANSDNALYIEMAKEYSNPPPLYMFKITGSEPGDVIPLDDTDPRLAYLFFRNARSKIFSQPQILTLPLWGILWVIPFCVSSFKLLQTKFTNAPAFYLFILTTGIIGASLIISLVEYSQPRYSYPMEFAYFISVALLPLLFEKK